MKRFLFATSLLAIPLLPSCTTYSAAHYVGAEGYELARTETANGTRDIYLLSGDESLTVRTEYERERPFLGFQVEEIGKEQAERLSIKPYSGLLVADTYAGSSARVGGVRPGDVLLALNGKPTHYREHLTQVEQELSDQQEVVATVQRGDEQLDLTLTVNLLREQVSDRQKIRLTTPPPNPRPYAGVTVGGIPRVWCERIFGEERDAIVVHTVELGSPAWVAGVRGGDVIEKVDGQPCPPVEELFRRIAAKGPAGDTMTWQVRREAGRTYEATLELADYRDRSAFHIPLLFGWRNSAASDRWSLGLGLLMSNRNDYVGDSSTREVKTRNVFSALLGLFKVDALPDETRVRLLWLIEFDT